MVDMVLGHEGTMILHAHTVGPLNDPTGVGIVQEVGRSCKTLKVGDRVGWGYTYGSCARCSACLTAHESYCPTALKYGVHHLDQGSFGNLAIKSEQWVFKIPDGIESRHAASLLCRLRLAILDR